jgi:hypothetical protein
VKAPRDEFFRDTFVLPICIITAMLILAAGMGILSLLGIDL